MKPLIAYKVTTSVKGNIVWKSEYDTLIIAGKNCGCSAKGECEDLDFQVEECLDYKEVQNGHSESLVKIV